MRKHFFNISQRFALDMFNSKVNITYYDIFTVHVMQMRK
jgi:hypothetical protein